VFMPALPIDCDDEILNPDDLKMPERAVRRRAVDLIGLSAARLLGPGHRVFRDLNWYPNDSGGPMASRQHRATAADLASGDQVHGNQAGLVMAVVRLDDQMGNGLLLGIDDDVTEVAKGAVGAMDGLSES